MSADFAHTLGAITPEYAEAVFDACEHGVSYDDECVACDVRTDLCQSFGAVTPNEIGIANRAYEAGLAATRQAAADTILATARRICCGDNPAPEHNARADHSQRMAFAEELARAVRGS